LAANFKNKGNEAFKSKDFKEALGYYHQSLDLNPDPKVYSNQAAVYLKLKRW
jgi:tetratricopeptide (TPR) repeat protein